MQVLHFCQIFERRSRRYVVNYFLRPTDRIWYLRIVRCVWKVFRLLDNILG